MLKPNMYFTAVYAFSFFEKSMKNEEVVLKFALKMEVSQCQGFTARELVCC